MAAEKVIQVGTKARDFTLKDQHNKEFTLSHFKGQKVLLAFHPLAWTEICATQMKTLEKNRRIFEKLNTVVVGISVDSIPCKNAWARSLRIKHTRLLADFWPHGAAAKSCGMLRDEEGFSERANIILDETGAVAFIKVYPIHDIPDIDEILGILGDR